MYPGRRQPRRISAARTRCAPASTCSTTTTPSRSRASVRGAYTFSSLANFLAGAYNNAGFTQTFGEHGRRRRPTPNLGLYVQDEWKRDAAADAQPRAALRPAVARDDRHRHQQRVAARRLRLVAVRRRADRSCAAAPACSTIACRCARSPTRCCRPATPPTSRSLRQINVSLSPTQAGAPVFPNILPAPVPSVTLVNLTTMDRDLQNAYSRQASLEVERQIGAVGTVSVGYQYLRGDELLMSINQNVPSCVAAGTNNGCRPNPDYANNSQYSSAGDVELPRPARVVRAAAGGVGLLAGQLHAVEVDEQRRRGLLQLADRSLRPVEGLGPVRRRPAASARGRRAASTRRWRRRPRRGSS